MKGHEGHTGTQALHHPPACQAQLVRHLVHPAQPGAGGEDAGEGPAQ